MIPCISQATTMPSSFADDLENFPPSGCRALEVWLTKLEQHLQTVSAADTIKAIEDRDISLIAAAYQGGLLLSQGDEHRAHLDHFKRRLDLCQTFGIPTLLLAADFTRGTDPRALARAAAALAEAARWAGGFNVRLALEFRGTNAVCTNLDTALSLVEQCGERNLGICFDCFHFYKGPSKAEDLGRLTALNLFHVQVSDVAGVPRETMTDSDRVMPGDGDFQFAPLLERLGAIGYAGGVSLELLNPELWGANPKQVIEIGMSALARLMGSSAAKA
jgi:sugar phosphate isomerase/epimerase